METSGQHPSSALDQEVNLMTRLHPENTAVEDQGRRDLASWQELASQPVAFDVSEARARLHKKLESAISEQDTLEQSKTWPTAPSAGSKS